MQVFVHVSWNPSSQRSHSPAPLIAHPCVLQFKAHSATREQIDKQKGLRWIVVIHVLVNNNNKHFVARSLRLRRTRPDLSDI